jgi:adenylate kinase family enzyme
MEITVDLLGKEIQSTTKSRVLVDGFPRALDQLVLFEEIVCLVSFL